MGKTSSSEPWKRAQFQGIGRGPKLQIIRLCESGHLGLWCTMLASASGMCGCSVVEERQFDLWGWGIIAVLELNIFSEKNRLTGLIP